MKNRHVTMKFVLSLCLSAFLLSAPMWGQVAGATISGTVTDSSGAVIANAQVSARNLATGVVTTGTTNTDGFYSVPNLLPGNYQVTFSATGFAPKAASATLTVGAKQVLGASLAVGEAKQQVEVTEAAPSIQLATSTISANVEQREVQDLPLNGRDWGSLATLQPGVSQVRTQEQVTQVGSHARGLGMQMSIDGNRPTQNTYRLNGVIINDYSNAGPGSVLGQNLGVDAIQEFSVLTSNYSSEYGFTSGGVINAITRSGTNQIHGSGYEFLRNSALDAPDFFEDYDHLKKAPFRRNQFGGSLGGPIKKDRIFFFADYEGLRQAKGITHQAKVLSPAARAGNLSSGPVTVDPTIAKFLNFYPLPNNGLIGKGDTGFYDFSGNQVVPENYLTTRGDVKLTDKDALNMSWYYDRSSFTQPDGMNNVLDQFAVGRQGAALEETHIFSSALGNTVRLGYNRTYGDGQLTPSAINPLAADKTLGIFPTTYAPRISVTGLTNFTGGLNGQSVQDYLAQTYQLYDDAILTKGTHNLKFGGMIVDMHNDLFAPFIEDGNATFSSLANLLQNIPLKAGAPANLSSIRTHHMRDWVFGLYVQDDWRARSNLTLNLGLRYEMSTIPHELNNMVQNLPEPWTNPATGPFNNFFFASNPTTKNFEPRIGFAWDPFKDQKTAVRGGIGLFDALPLPYELIINNAQTAPFRISATASVPGKNLPQGTFPKGIAPLLVNPAPSNLAWNYVTPNPKRNYVVQYNFNIQRQLPGATSLTLAYAGSRGVHNPFQMDDMNTVYPSFVQGRWVFPIPNSPGIINPNPTGIVPGQLINPNVLQLQTTLWSSMSYYNSLQVRVDKQVSHGLQLQAAFTWAKTMDTSSGSFAGDNFAGDLSPTTPWWDLKIVRGLSDFNVGRNLVVNLLYNVPSVSNSPAAWIARGWQVGTIVKLQDGVPVWPLWGIDSDPMGQLNNTPIAIPDRVANCSMTTPGSIQYVNPNCFTVAQAPSQSFYNQYCDPSHAFPRCDNLLGNLGRNTVIGPGLVNMDYSMVKNNYVRRISEAFNVQFRAEFFNVLNHANFAPPSDNLEVLDASGKPLDGFGTLDATQVPMREIQFALKVIW